jgi:hypothetical protein
MADALDIFKSRGMVHEAARHGLIRREELVSLGEPPEPEPGEVFDLSGPDRLSKARAMAEGDVGILPDGQIVVMEVGQLEPIEKARSHKYTSRKRVGSKWVYEYGEAVTSHGRGSQPRGDSSATDRDREMSGKVRASMAKYQDQGMSPKRAMAQIAADHPGVDMTTLKRWAAGRGAKGGKIEAAPAAEAPKAAKKKQATRAPRAAAAPAAEEPEPKPKETPAVSQGDKAKAAYNKYLADGMSPKRAFGQIALENRDIDAKTLRRWLKSMFTDLSGPDRLSKARAMAEGDIGVMYDGTVVVKSRGRLGPVVVDRAAGDPLDLFKSRAAEPASFRLGSVTYHNRPADIKPASVRALGAVRPQE